MGSERETRVYTLKNWRKMFPGRGASHSESRTGKASVGNCRKLSVVRKLANWTW